MILFLFAFLDKITEPDLRFAKEVAVAHHEFKKDQPYPRNGTRQEVNNHSRSETEKEQKNALSRNVSRVRRG